MSRRNENRPGYKITDVGWIPQDWRCSTGAEITELIGKGASPKWQGFEYTTSGMLFITSENVRDGYLDLSNPKYLPIEFHNKLRRTQIRKGDILINLVGASIGRSCSVSRKFGNANVNQAVCVFRVKNDICREYISYYFQNPSTIKRILRMQVDAARPNISLGNLREFRIAIPRFAEQNEIAGILSTWDIAIEQTRKLIESKKRRKKALMQQLFFTKKQSTFGRSAWKKYRLKDLLKEVSQPIDFHDEDFYDLISVRRRSEGIFHRGRVSGKDILTKQLYRTCSGDFIISKMQVVHGASALVTEQFDGLSISGSYIALRCKDKKKLSMDFFNWLSRTPRFYHLTYLSSYGVHIEKMTFNLKLFLKSEISIPGKVEEQERIADFLGVIGKEIGILEKQLAALEKQKRGLMQKLLTGEVRVKV